MVLKATVQKEGPKQSHPKVTSEEGMQLFFKIGDVRNFARFTGKHMCWSIFFKKVASLTNCNFT